MSDRIEQTMFSELLVAISAEFDAHRDDSRWREILARIARCRGSLTFGVGIYDESSAQVVDHYEIRILGSRFEVVNHGHRDWPVDWRVTTDQLRRIRAGHDAGIERPDRFDLRWLETRLGIPPSPA